MIAFNSTFKLLKPLKYLPEKCKVIIHIESLKTGSGLNIFTRKKTYAVYSLVYIFYLSIINSSYYWQNIVQIKVLAKIFLLSINNNWKNISVT